MTWRPPLRGPARSSIRLRIALGLLAALAIGLAAVVAQRRALAERALTRWLDAYGIASAARVSGLGFRGIEIADIALGPAGDPDLTAKRVRLRWSLGGLAGRHAERLEVTDVRLRARWSDDGLTLGALDRLLLPAREPPGPDGKIPERTPTGGPPFDSASLRDVHVTIELPAGSLTAEGAMAIERREGARRAHLEARLTTPWGPARLITELRPPATERPLRWRAKLAAPLVVLPDDTARLTRARVGLRARGDSVAARFTVARVAPGTSPPAFGPLAVAGTAVGGLERMQVESIVRAAEDPLVATLSGAVEPRARRARLALDLPETSLDGVRLARVWPALEGVVEEVHGLACVKGTVSYDAPGLRAEVDVGLRNGDVTIGFVALRGVNAAVTIRLLPALSTPPRQMIAVALLEAALPLADGLVVFQLSPDELSIERAAWRFAEGTVQTSGRLPLAAHDRTLTLTTDGVDLGTLLASLALEGLSGSGTLGGRLPVRQRDGRLSIERGRLAATAPGALRYEPRPGTEAMRRRHRELDVLLTALEDFHYDQLELTLDGELAEPMQMTLHIRGRNPRYEGGRPVVLNVNVEAPLTGLVRSGGSAYRVPAAIQKRLESMGLKGRG